jgi:hypothetical protein
MPPISIGPNWPKPVIIGNVLSGRGCRMVPISGGHHDLLRRGGVYADLWARQSGGFMAD